MFSREKIAKLLIIVFISTSFAALAEEDAARYFAAGDWPAAAQAYTRLTASRPDDGNAWFRLAVSSRQIQRYDVASDALQRAEALQFSAVRIALERARLAVLTGHANDAVSELQFIVDGGFSAVGVISADPVLSSLAGNGAFDALVARMSRQAFPCEYDAAFSAFDFWVGVWEVQDSSGAVVGSNSIERAQRGCLLIENWTGASGSTGTSINYLDKISGDWVQVWNDAGGNQINIRGGMTDEGMLLTGTIHYVASGTTAAFRGLWTPMPDGRVRQFFEQQSADGDSWSPWFEGFYSRKTVD